ncbi:hypothetical protein DFH09DRAFT_1076463 [Mycena vulgaris]|nr:hypothetical protein DFH09DRAFT_1076463 [Mycena vulgaris]
MSLRMTSMLTVVALALCHVVRAVPAAVEDSPETRTSVFPDPTSEADAVAFFNTLGTQESTVPGENRIFCTAESCKWCGSKIYVFLLGPFLFAPSDPNELWRLQLAYLAQRRQGAGYLLDQKHGPSFAVLHHFSLALGMGSRRYRAIPTTNGETI